MSSVAFYTYDLFPGREYLMPWRTIIEIAAGMKTTGTDVCILNACYNDVERNNWQLQGMDVIGIVPGYSVLANQLMEKGIGTVFIPFTWREGLKDLSALKGIPCKKIAYIAGGVYDLKSALVLYKSSSLTLAKPYLIESILPKSFLGYALRTAGFSHTISLTSMTAKFAESAKAPDCVCIYPGKDDIKSIPCDRSVLEKYRLGEQKFLLYSGAPTPTRGAQMLVQSIDRVKTEELRVVLLIRSDKGSNYEELEKFIAKMKRPERIIVINERLTREQLFGFFAAAWYAILPFIVIPSEVPLTYYELLSLGTPVISFPNGGTTDYLNKGLWIAEKSVKGLAFALDHAWADADGRQNKSIAGRQIMQNHPVWAEVARQWQSLTRGNE